MQRILKLMAASVIAMIVLSHLLPVTVTTPLTRLVSHIYVAHQTSDQPQLAVILTPLYPANQSGGRDDAL